MSAAGRPSDLHPRRVAHDLGLVLHHGEVTWTDVLEAAVRAYWSNRPEPECGTYPGYLLHLRQNTPPCPDCRRARAQVAAIQRRRRAA